MTTTLFDLTYRTAVALGQVYEGTATGGGTTSLIDTVERTEGDDYWNGGTVWVLYDAGGAGAAPQGEYSVVTDFSTSSDTATLRSTLTAAIASGDQYGIARKKFPLSLLISKVNEAIRKVGTIPVTNTTSLTTASGQTEYTLPAQTQRVMEVLLQTDNTDSDDNRPKPIPYDIRKAATGTANTLVIAQYDAGYAIYVTYEGLHNTLVSATSELDDIIHPDRIVYRAAELCSLWRRARVGESDPTLPETINYFKSEADKADALNPINRRGKPGSLLVRDWL